MADRLPDRWARLFGASQFHAWTAAGGTYMQSRCGLMRAHHRLRDDPLEGDDPADPGIYCGRCGPKPMEAADVAADEKRAELRDERAAR